MAEQPVKLPATVESLIEQICVEQNQPPLDHFPRRQLASIGEQKALELLNIISKDKIRISFDGFIVTLMKNSFSKYVSPHKPSPPPSSLPESSISPSRSQLPSHPPLTALGELEFRKSFLLMSYAGEENIANFVNAEDVERLKNLPMRDFENKVWEAVNKKRVVDHKERQLYLDWDSGRTHVYECHVSSNGSLRFKGPILQSTRTHLQKSLGDDNVLLVKFSDFGWNSKTSTSSAAQEAAKLYWKFGKQGICVGHRLYRFFGNPVTF